MSKAIALVLLILLFPVWPLLYIAVKLDSHGPFIFKQKRVGKNKKKFTIYKIRTMVENADKLRSKYKKLNQADGPIFKIYNDPRFTRVGKILAHNFLDELPQLFNIVKDDMAFIGPRPLLIPDVKGAPRKYDARFSILPGLSSPWNIEGRYRLTFDEWMMSDLEYVKKKSLWCDTKILFLTVVFILKTFVAAVIKHG